MSSPCVNCGADAKVCKECDWYNGVWMPKDQYEARLKSDLKAILVELQLEFEELYPNPELNTYYRAVDDCSNLIQQKIDALKEGVEE